MIVQESQQPDRTQIELSDFYIDLSELQNTEETLGKIDWQTVVRERDEAYQEVMDSIQGYLDAQAKCFGVKLDKLDAKSTGKMEIVAEYQEILDTIEQNYGELLVDLSEWRENLQEHRQGLMIESKQNRIDYKYARQELTSQKKDLESKKRQSYSDGNEELFQQYSEALDALLSNGNDLLEELRNQHKDIRQRLADNKQELAKCDERYDATKQAMKEEMTEIKGDRGQELVNYDRSQNIFQRAIQALYNIFSGNDRLMKEVMEPEKVRVAGMKEKTSALKEKILQRRKELYAETHGISIEEVEKAVEENNPTGKYVRSVVDISHKSNDRRRQMMEQSKKRIEEKLQQRRGMQPSQEVQEAVEQVGKLEQTDVTRTMEDEAKLRGMSVDELKEAMKHDPYLKNAVDSLGQRQDEELTQ